MFTSDRRYRLLPVFLIFSLMTFIQILFYYIQYSQVHSISKGLEGILRRDLNGSDSYYISKSIKNLEHLNLLSCSILTSLKIPNQSYLNLATNKNCKSNFLTLNGVSATKIISSLNGDKWVLSFKSVNNQEFYLALWLTRVISILFILVVFRFYIEKIEKKFQLMEMRNEHINDLERVYRQVSHDIRSPLAALNMAMKDLDQLPEATRLILRGSIQRIQDIANNLLTKTNKKEFTSPSTEELETALLHSLLDEIISEKRLQFRSKVAINIEGDLTGGFGLFAKINGGSLKRAISNFINNAVEALPDKKGAILLSIEKRNGRALIKVKDNGKGIPPEVLKELGKEGATFGKENSNESGSGIGLHHAITTIEKWGGRLYLESTVGVGTIVNIELPLTSSPSWFQTSIKLKRGDTVVILDDDHEIHHTWDEKFKHYVSSKKLNIVHLTTPEETRKFFTNKALDDLFLLSDYELIGYKETGLDLIDELNLSSISTLVTSHYTEDEIQSKCVNLGFKILPKMIAMDIKIEFAENSKSDPQLDAVYIEDDKWLRKGWDKASKKANKSFISIDCPENFFDIQNKVSKEKTEIYIDQNYNNSTIKGTDFARILHNQGYKKLFLATGIKPERELPVWLTIIGKDCPWGT